MAEITAHPAGKQWSVFAERSWVTILIYCFSGKVVSDGQKSAYSKRGTFFTIEGSAPPAPDRASRTTA